MKMRSAQYFLMLQCYVITLATKPRSVNLALETTFEFNNKQDVSIIQKVRNFLNKIENAVDTKLAKRNGETEFTDFLQDLISTINTYDDDDFKQVFRVLDDVVHKFKTKDNKFNEIYNNRLKYYLSEILKKINKAPARFLRSQLKRNLRVMKKDMNVDFLKFLNMIYKKKSTNILKQTLDNFKNYGKKTRTSDVDLNLRDIIEKAVKSLVNDRYSNLNEDSQRDVQTWIKTLTKNPEYDEMDNQKEKTSKKTYMKKKHVNIREKYTFVTLYPEMITYNMKYIEETTRMKKEKHLKEKYEIKEFRPVLNDDNSSNSLEYSWQTRQTQKKRVTPFWQTIPKSVKMKYPKNKPFGIYNNPYKFQLPYMLRRTEFDESNATKNETCPKEIISANYLSKIKKLEEELQRVREQLKAKLTTLKKDSDTDVENKNNELYFRVSDLSSPVTLKDITNRPKMIEFKPIVINNTIENNTKYSEEVSHESREMSFDVPYNMTYIDHRNQSIYITNQTSMELFSPEPTLVVKNVTTKLINKPLAITTNLTDVEDTTIYFKKINNTVSHEAIDL